MSVTDISRPAKVSEEEWNARVDLAACYRLFIRYGWTDLIFTHLTARVPDAQDQYLINPYGLLFEEITASNLLKVDFDGNVISGEHPYNHAGHAIHTAVLKVRPEVNAVLHSHTRAGMAVSAMTCGLLPLTQQANELRDELTYHDYQVATSSEEECRLLGVDIQDRYTMVMRNHGLLTCGRTVGEAFYYMYTLENACKVQVDVMASGAEMITPPESALETLSEWGKAPSTKPNTQSELAWPALLRGLDRTDPSYRS